MTENLPSSPESRPPLDLNITSSTNLHANANGSEACLQLSKLVNDELVLFSEEHTLLPSPQEGHTSKQFQEPSTECGAC